MKLGIAGAAGRMGGALIRAAIDGGFEIAAACEQPGNTALGRDAGQWIGIEALGIVIGDDPKAMVAASDVVLDFTTPSASVPLAQLTARAGKALVLGTTGFAAADDAAIKDAAMLAPIVRSGNFSLGVNVLINLVARAARALPQFDIEIIEAHHRHKIDAPSGTALMLGDAAAAARDQSLKSIAASERRGHTGPRQAGSIGFQSLRGGTIVGEHIVVMAGDGERIELGHVAEDRAIFAKGAIAAAHWVLGRSPGLYSVADVLGLN